MLACRVGSGRIALLRGSLAVTWLALDEPAGIDDLVERIRAAGVEPGDLSAALAELVGSRFVVRRDP